MRIFSNPELVRSPKRWVLGLMIGVGLLACGSPTHAYEDYVPTSGENTVCTLCHTCEFPTRDDLCLSKQFCQRSQGALGHGGLPGQKIMVMDEMEKVYDPVYFNHEIHAQMSAMSKGCVECHHFMPPSAGHPACKECHLPESMHGKVEPGLKAAYHLQ